MKSYFDYIDAMAALQTMDECKSLRDEILAEIDNEDDQRDLLGALARRELTIAASKP